MERVHTGSDTGIKECISVKLHNEDDCFSEKALVIPAIIFVNHFFGWGTT